MVTWRQMSSSAQRSTSSAKPVSYALTHPDEDGRVYVFSRKSSHHFCSPQVVQMDDAFRFSAFAHNHQ